MHPIRQKLGPYAKTVTALVTGGLSWGGYVLASEPSGVTGTEWLALGVIVATAVGVYAVPNKPAG